MIMEYPAGDIERLNIKIQDKTDMREKYKRDKGKR